MKENWKGQFPAILKKRKVPEIRGGLNFANFWKIQQAASWNGEGFLLVAFAKGQVVRVMKDRMKNRMKV